MRYRIYSVSKRDYEIGGRHFPNPGDAFLFSQIEVTGRKLIVNTGWHHEKIVPGISFRERNVRVFYFPGKTLAHEHAKVLTFLEIKRSAGMQTPRKGGKL